MPEDLVVTIAEVCVWRMAATAMTRWPWARILSEVWHEITVSEGQMPKCASPASTCMRGVFSYLVSSGLMNSTVIPADS